MHDIRLIRENPEAFGKMLEGRGFKRNDAAVKVAAIIQYDIQRRICITNFENLQAERNEKSKRIGAAKAAGDNLEFAKLSGEVSLLKNQIALAEKEAKEWDERLKAILLRLPNAPLDSVPQGMGEDENVEINRHGGPRKFAFQPKQHYELGEAMGCMDFEAAAKLSGARFVVLKGALTRLHRALAQFMLDTHVDENGLTEIWTPVLVLDGAMYGTGQLPKFAEDSFVGDWFSGRAARLRKALSFTTQSDIDAIASGNPIEDVVEAILDRAPTEEGYWLIPTAEVTLTNLISNEIVDEATLPRRYAGWTQCFRSEAGSAGKDTRGMLRQHQFEKVEMVSITRPEDSLAELDRMTRCAEGILKRLEIPYRTVVLCTGDMGFGARRTHDLEVWLPGQNAYREISSCSVCGDFQARRMNGRFRREGEKRPEFVHTLNGSGLAVGRSLIAVMENYQEEDGSITIPKVLRPYMRNATRIAPDGSLD